MSQADDFIKEFLQLQHAYDPVYARQYYLRKRKLKGRKPGSKKILSEDEVPSKSPSGARLVDFNGKDGGKATYSDGSVLSVDGWTKPVSNSDKQTKVSSARRLNNAQLQISRIRSRINSVKDPVRKRDLLRRLSVAERRLSIIKKKLNNE